MCQQHNWTFFIWTMTKGALKKIGTLPVSLRIFLYLCISCYATLNLLLECILLRVNCHCWINRHFFMCNPQNPEWTKELCIYTFYFFCAQPLVGGSAEVCLPLLVSVSEVVASGEDVDTKSLGLYSIPEMKPHHRRPQMTPFSKDVSTDFIFFPLLDLLIATICWWGKWGLITASLQYSHSCREIWFPRWWMVLKTSECVIICSGWSIDVLQMEMLCNPPGGNTDNCGNIQRSIASVQISHIISQIKHFIRLVQLLNGPKQWNYKKTIKHRRKYTALLGSVVAFAKWAPLTFWCEPSPFCQLANSNTNTTLSLYMIVAANDITNSRKMTASSRHHLWKLLLFFLWFGPVTCLQ